jgi:D-arabinitol dehydrogenase (NADP+)
MTAINGATNGTTAKFVIPTEMKAIRYNKVKDFSLVMMPVPQPKGHEVLIKGTPSMKRARILTDLTKP